MAKVLIIGGLLFLLSPLLYASNSDVIASTSATITNSSPDLFLANIARLIPVTEDPFTAILTLAWKNHKPEETPIEAKGNDYSVIGQNKLVIQTSTPNLAIRVLLKIPEGVSEADKPHLTLGHFYDDTFEWRFQPLKTSLASFTDVGQSNDALEIVLDYYPLFYPPFDWDGKSQTRWTMEILVLKKNK